jgi:7,8-dihydropterin-6-yl-methyl-4-(beta-D-ribofuranosyl)aminobenzene 5'-phosphate synthase
LIVVDNWIDMLLPERSHDCSPGVGRLGLVEHFDARRVPPQAENGISILATAVTANRKTRILFDAGLTGTVLMHNLNLLGETAEGLDHLVISHGHPDHYGGVFQLLDQSTEHVSVLTHKDAFLPRFAIMPDGRVSGFYNREFKLPQLEDRGARVALTTSPVDLGPGVITSGVIPRPTDFEAHQVPEDLHRPGLYQVASDGTWRQDDVWDEQALIVDVGKSGIVVLTGCAHAGVVNTVKRAIELVGDRPVAAVIGGFHLGFPTTPVENVTRTVEALSQLGVQAVMPMHCSGLRAHSSFSASQDVQYLQPSVATRLHFE